MKFQDRGSIIMRCIDISKIALRQQVEYRSTRCIRRGHCLWDEQSNDVSYEITVISICSTYD